MKFKKVLAGIAAVAMVTAAVPLSVTVSAEGYNVGDRFYAKFDPSTGEVEYITDDINYIAENSGAEDNGFYTCTVLDNKSISVATETLGHAYVHGWLGHEYSIVIPSEIADYTVTEISSWCGGGYISVTIPDTVKKLNMAAFWSCYYLEEIIFGENSQLEVIGDYAFQDCRSLKSVTIPASVKELGEGAFMNTFDKTLDVPGGIDFADTYSLTSVKVAEGSQLETIGEYAFQNQQVLQSVWIPESVTAIGKTAFIYNPDDLTIYGYTKSYAESYANEQEINFVALDSAIPETTDQPDVTIKPEDDVTIEAPDVTTTTTAAEVSSTTEAPNVTTTTAVTEANDITEDGNAPTGLVITFIPTITAAAGVVISKKRK